MIPNRFCLHWSDPVWREVAGDYLGGGYKLLVGYIYNSYNNYYNYNYNNSYNNNYNNSYNNSYYNYYNNNNYYNNYYNYYNNNSYNNYKTRARKRGAK